MLKGLLKPLINIVDSMADYFFYIVILFYSLYIGLYLGLADSKYEKYLVPLKTGIRIFIGSFLLLHFNPISYKTKLNKTDIRIIGSSSSVILFDALFSTYTTLNTLYRAESKEIEGFKSRSRSRSRSSISSKKKPKKKCYDSNGIKEIPCVEDKNKKKKGSGMGMILVYIVIAIIVLILGAAFLMSR